MLGGKSSLFVCLLLSLLFYMVVLNAFASDSGWQSVGCRQWIVLTGLCTLNLSSACQVQNTRRVSWKCYWSPAWECLSLPQAACKTIFVYKFILALFFFFPLFFHVPLKKEATTAIQPTRAPQLSLSAFMFPTVDTKDRILVAA